MWEHSGRMYRPDRGAASTRMAVKQDRTAHTGPWIHLLPRRPERRLGLVQAIRRPRRVASSAALGSQEIPEPNNQADHNHRFHHNDCQPHAVHRHRLPYADARAVPGTRPERRNLCRKSMTAIAFDYRPHLIGRTRGNKWVISALRLKSGAQLKPYGTNIAEWDFTLCPPVIPMSYAWQIPGIEGTDCGGQPRISKKPVRQPPTPG